MTQQLEDRVVAVEEYSRDTSVELRNITYRLDSIDQRLGTVEGAAERIENRVESIETTQQEHTKQLQKLDTDMSDIKDLLTQILQRLPG